MKTDASGTGLSENQSEITPMWSPTKAGVVAFLVVVGALMMLSVVLAVSGYWPDSEITKRSQVIGEGAVKLGLVVGIAAGLSQRWRVKKRNKKEGIVSL